jgi:hypothetical protein
MTSKKDTIMGKGEKTTLTRANDKSYSLRTTVPKGIVSNFDLKEGDSLYWVIKPNGNKLLISVEVEHKRGK